jgi:O-antigen/teichoic acid export membrane protein
VLKGDSAVGSYNAAYKIVFVLLVLPTLYNQSMAPAISALAVRSAPKLARLLDGSVRLALVVALPLAVGGTFLARQIIGLLYGTGYEPAIPALQVLVWAAAVSYLSCLFGTTVLYTGLERAYMVGVTLGAVVNTALNLLLIPWFDLRGAAVATVVAELAVAVWMYRSVRRVIRGSLLVHLWPAAVACVPMVLMLFLTLGWALGYRLALGVLSYFTAVVLTGGIRIADFHMLTSSADPNQSPAAAVQFSRT